MASFIDPEETEIKYLGVTYNVDTSFNNIIKLMDLCQETNLTSENFIIIFLKLAIGHVPKFENANFYSELIEGIISNFILINREEVDEELDIQGNPIHKKLNNKIDIPYDLEFDSDLIIAAFFQTYNIDLVAMRNKLTWSKFNALLNGLPSDTRFMEVIDIRTREMPKGKGTGKEAKELKKLKKRFALPDSKRGEETKNE